MEDIVYEIVGGALILGIILVVLAVFRNSADTIRTTVSNQAVLEDTSIVDTIGIDGGTYSADKILEAWNYSKVSDVAFQVEVKNGSRSEIITEDSQAQAYGSNNSKRYKLTVMYLKEVTTANSISLNSDLVLQKGEQGICCVRFLFTQQ